MVRKPLAFLSKVIHLLVYLDQLLQICRLHDKVDRFQIKVEQLKRENKNKRKSVIKNEAHLPNLSLVPILHFLYNKCAIVHSKSESFWSN